MSSVERHPSRATALWATGSGHGRSPALTMRHTVDDKLQVATHVSFLSLRAMMHRNRDSILLLSEELVETKLSNPSSSDEPGRTQFELPSGAAGATSMAITTVSRSLILTDRHCYCVSMPAIGLFASASSGGCFQWTELSRVLLSAPPLGVDEETKNDHTHIAASLPTRGRHIVLQFLNGIVVLQSQSSAAARRVADVVYGATGVKAEVLEHEDETVAAVKQRAAAQPPAPGSSVVAVYATAAAASIAPSHGMASGSSMRSSRPGALVPSVGTTVGTGRSAESVLRRLVDAEIAADVRRNAPEVGCQTEPQNVCDASCSVGCSSSHLVTRSTSPPLDSVDSRLLSFAVDPEVASDRTSSTAAGSDFDAKDIWKSLRTVPPKGGGGPASTARPSSRSATSPGRQGLAGPKSVSPSGRAGASMLNRSSREVDADEDELLASTRRDMGRSTTTSPSFGAKPEDRRLSLASSSTAAAAAAASAVKAGGTSSGTGTNGHQQQTQMQPQQQPQQEASMSSSASLDDFLGVLSVYRPVFSRLGYHSASQFAKLSDSEVDQLLDAAGVAKQGHRMLLHSKLALGRQQQAQAQRSKR